MHPFLKYVIIANWCVIFGGGKLVLNTMLIHFDEDSGKTWGVALATYSDISGVEVVQDTAGKRIYWKNGSLQPHWTFLMWRTS